MTVPAAANPRAGVAGLDPGAAGVTPPSDPERHGAFLADVVVELGFADREKVDEAAEAASQSCETVDRFLLDNGVLDEDQLSLAIAERNGLDHVDLDRFEVDMEAAGMIGSSTALRHRAVPIAFAADGALIVAVEDPLDPLGLRDIEVMTRSEVRRVISSRSGIRKLAERLPDEPAERPEPVELRSVPSAPKLVPPPEEEGPEEPAAGPPAPEPSRGEESPQEPPPAPPEPQPEPSADGDLGALVAELRTLQEAARRADALAVTAERRIRELEGAGERAEQAERDLAETRERNADLERRLSGVDRAAAELRATTEKLEAIYEPPEAAAG
jgi:hypothetical protein